MNIVILLVILLFLYLIFRNRKGAYPVEEKRVPQESNFLEDIKEFKELSSYDFEFNDSDLTSLKKIGKNLETFYKQLESEFGKENRELIEIFTRLAQCQESLSKIGYLNKENILSFYISLGRLRFIFLERLEKTKLSSKSPLKKHVGLLKEIVNQTCSLIATAHLRTRLLKTNKFYEKFSRFCSNYQGNSILKNIHKNQSSKMLLDLLVENMEYLESQKENTLTPLFLNHVASQLQKLDNIIKEESKGSIKHKDFLSHWQQLFLRMTATIQGFSEKEEETDTTDVDATSMQFFILIQTICLNLCSIYSKHKTQFTKEETIARHLESVQRNLLHALYHASPQQLPDNLNLLSCALEDLNKLVDYFKRNLNKKSDKKLLEKLKQFSLELSKVVEDYSKFSDKRKEIKELRDCKQSLIKSIEKIEKKLARKRLAYWANIGLVRNRNEIYKGLVNANVEKIYFGRFYLEEMNKLLTAYTFENPLFKLVNKILDPFILSLCTLLYKGNVDYDYNCVGMIISHFNKCIVDLLNIKLDSNSSEIFKNALYYEDSQEDEVDEPSKEHQTDQEKRIDKLNKKIEKLKEIYKKRTEQLSVVEQLMASEIESERVTTRGFYACEKRSQLAIFIFDTLFVDAFKANKKMYSVAASYKKAVMEFMSLIPLIYQKIKTDEIARQVCAELERTKQAIESTIETDSGIGEYFYEEKDDEEECEEECEEEYKETYETAYVVSSFSDEDEDEDEEESPAKGMPLD